MIIYSLVDNIASRRHRENVQLNQLSIDGRSKCDTGHGIMTVTKLLIEKQSQNK